MIMMNFIIHMVTPKWRKRIQNSHLSYLLFHFYFLFEMEKHIFLYIYVYSDLDKPNVHWPTANFECVDIRFARGTKPKVALHNFLY